MQSFENNWRPGTISDDELDACSSLTVGLGSDFDGARKPHDLSDVTALPALLDTLRRAGFDESDGRALVYENWLRVLNETWDE